MFSRDPDSGAATQLPGSAGCLTLDGASNGVANACGFAAAVGAANQPIVSPDGRSLYIASEGGQSVTIFNVESAPVCQAATASTAYQTPVAITLSCTDADGDPVTPSIASDPAYGSVGPIADGGVTYTPVPGYSGPDSFTFDATDGTNTSAPASVTIAVAAAPAPPAPPAVQGQSTQAPAPVAHLTNVTQSHRSWREAKHGGTTFAFRLNQAARVSFIFTQRGHRRPLGRLTVAGHPGRNKVAFNGVINRHLKLKPGTYTVTITTGTSTRRLIFTIVK